MYKTVDDSVKSFQPQLWGWKTEEKIKYGKIYEFPDAHCKTSCTYEN